MSAFQSGLSARFAFLRLQRPLLALVSVQTLLLLLGTSQFSSRVFAHIPGSASIALSQVLSALLALATFILELTEFRGHL